MEHLTTKRIRGLLQRRTKTKWSHVLFSVKLLLCSMNTGCIQTNIKKKLDSFHKGFYQRYQRIYEDWVSSCCCVLKEWEKQFCSRERYIKPWWRCNICLKTCCCYGKRRFTHEMKNLREKTVFYLIPSCGSSLFSVSSIRAALVARRRLRVFFFLAVCSTL